MEQNAGLRKAEENALIFRSLTTKIIEREYILVEPEVEGEETFSPSPPSVEKEDEDEVPEEMRGDGVAKAESGKTYFEDEGDRVMCEVEEDEDEDEDEESDFAFW